MVKPKLTALFRSLPLTNNLFLHGIGATILLAILAGGYFWGYSVFRNEYDSAAATNAENEMFLRSADRLHARNKELAADRQKLQSERDSFEDRLPSGANETELLADVMHLARMHGVRVRKFDPVGLAAEKNYHALQIEMDTDGGYPDLVRFLDQLRKLPRPMTFGRFCVRASGSGNSCGLDLAIRAYYKEEPRRE